MIKNGGMSKDNVLETMGHSAKMFDKTYTHVTKEEVKEMLKEQIYNFEDMPEEKKLELQKQINEQKEEIKSQKDDNHNLRLEMRKIQKDFIELRNLIRMTPRKSVKNN